MNKYLFIVVVISTLPLQACTREQEKIPEKIYVREVTESYIEVLYGGVALHYCVEKYDINDAKVILVKGEK